MERERRHGYGAEVEKVRSAVNMAAIDSSDHNDVIKSVSS